MRKFIFKSSTHYYGSEQDDPAFFTEEMRRPHPPHAALERDMRRGRAGGGRVRGAKPKGHGHGAALRQRARPRRRHGVHADVRAAAGADDARLRPAAAVRARGRRRARARARRVPPSRRASTTSRPTGCWRSPRSSACWASGALPVLPPWGTGLLAGPLRRLGFRIPDEAVNQLRFGRGVDNRLLKATGFRYGYTTRETVLKLGEHLRLAPVMRGVEHTVHLRARGRGVPALEPHVRREHPGERGGVAADREPLGI